MTCIEFNELHNIIQKRMDEGGIYTAAEFMASRNHLLECTQCRESNHKDFEEANAKLTPIQIMVKNYQALQRIASLNLCNDPEL